MADSQTCFRCSRKSAPAEMIESPAGNYFCADCWTQLAPTNEGLRKCPVDGLDMIKRRVADVVVIDRCAKCGGTWFDRGELQVIERKSREMGWQEGFFLSIMLL